MRSSAMSFAVPSASETKIWRKAGIVERAVAPSSCGATGTSRQPRTVRPSAAAIVSICETAAALSASSTGRKPMPTAYAPAVGQVEGDRCTQEGVRDLGQDARSVTRVGLGTGGTSVLQVAQNRERLFDQRVARLAGEGGHEADAAGVVLVAGVVHALSSRASIHVRLVHGVLGRLARRAHRLSRRRFSWHMTSAEGRRWPSAGVQISCRLHGGADLGNRILRSNMRTPRSR